MVRTVPLINFSSSNKLVIMGDIHLGAEDFDEKHFDEALTWVKKNKAYIYLIGDLVDNSIVEGKAPGEKLMNQKLWPTEQVKEFVDKLKPFAKRGQIIGSLRGNHEARTRRTSLLDICELIAHMLDIRYDEIGGMIRVKSGRNIYTLALHHGRRGGSNPWVELDHMKKLYPSADLYAAGHIHVLATKQVNNLSISSDGTECISSKFYIRTGTYQGYSDYPRELCMEPATIGSPVITFSSNKFHLDVDCKTLSWV